MDTQLREEQSGNLSTLGNGAGRFLVESSMNAHELMPARTEMGPVALWVANLDTMIAFYRDAVGLELLSHEGPVAILGTPHSIVVRLEHHPEMVHASSGQAGLFHTAIVYPTQSALARAVYSVASRFPDLFTGSADHLVSKAFYFDDPEGNGVELYWDRERSEWNWSGGSVQMATLPLDPQSFLGEHLDAELPGIAQNVGHVHLSVGSISLAEEFYVKALGFETTFRMGDQALFVSAGGYHHHMAMNTWRSRGAGRRQPTLGLADITISLPSLDDVIVTADRLRHLAVPVSREDRLLRLADPWGNQITITSDAEVPASRP